jgi:hypothetical protein
MRLQLSPLAKHQEVNYDYDHVNNIIIQSDCDQDQPVSMS